MTAMDAEFDTMARWTAEAALQLGPDFYVPAGCRGSGGPVTLDGLLDDLDVDAHTRMLDIGAGVGGPAGYAAQTAGVRPVLVEPQPDACRSARSLFDLPTVQGEAGALPFADASFDVAWILGVLCTTTQHRRTLREMQRVLVPGGRAGLLVYVALHDLPDTPEGNHFPAPDELITDVETVGLQVGQVRDMAPADAESSTWRDRTAAVEHALAARHEHDEAFQEAERQSTLMGRLLSEGHLVGRIVVAQRTRV